MSVHVRYVYVSVVLEYTFAYISEGTILSVSYQTVVTDYIIESVLGSVIVSECLLLRLLLIGS